jgi:hypothetical protein
LELEIVSSEIFSVEEVVDFPSSPVESFFLGDEAKMN